MHEITNKVVLSTDVKRIEVKAPLVARQVRPGQFVAVCADETDFFLPLPVTDMDSRRGVVTLVVRENLLGTRGLSRIPIKDEVFSVIGPFGGPEKIEKRGLVFCAADELGPAWLLPICKALKEAGNKVIGLMSAENKDALILEPQMRLACSKLFMATADGSYERRGTAVDLLHEHLAQEQPVLLYMAGSVDFMRTAAEMAPAALEIRAVLEPLVFSGVFPTGASRIRYDDQTILIEDGPVFDARKVDFAFLRQRYRDYAAAARPQAEGGSETPSLGRMFQNWLNEE